MIKKHSVEFIDRIKKLIRDGIPNHTIIERTGVSQNFITKVKNEMKAE